MPLREISRGRGDLAAHAVHSSRWPDARRGFGCGTTMVRPRPTVTVAHRLADDVGDWSASAPIGAPIWNTRVLRFSTPRSARVSPGAARRTLRRQRSAGERLSQSAGADCRALRRMPLRPPRRADVPDRGSRAAAGRRGVGISWPRRPAGEDSRISHRARRDRDGPPRSRRRAAGGRRASPDGRRNPAGGLPGSRRRRCVECGVHARASGEAATSATWFPRGSLSSTSCRLPPMASSTARPWPTCGSPLQRAGGRR